MGAAAAQDPRKESFRPCVSFLAGASSYMPLCQGTPPDARPVGRKTVAGSSPSSGNTFGRRKVLFGNAPISPTEPGGPLIEIRRRKRDSNPRGIVTILGHPCARKAYRSHSRLQRPVAKARRRAKWVVWRMLQAYFRELDRSFGFGQPVRRRPWGQLSILTVRAAAKCELRGASHKDAGARGAVGQLRPF